MNLECKLTSCDLKYKRSLLPQIKSWGLLAKLVRVSGPAGTSAGRAGHPRCCHVHEDGSASSSLKAVCPGHNVRPGCGLSIPDGPSLLICSLRDFQVYRTPTQGARSQDPVLLIFLASSCLCCVRSGQGTAEGPSVSPRCTRAEAPKFSCVPTPKAPWTPEVLATPPDPLPTSLPLHRHQDQNSPLLHPIQGSLALAHQPDSRTSLPALAVEMLNRSQGNREDVLTHRAWLSQPFPSSL